MYLNNKGFAISGILYTLYIIFLIILSTILASISFKKNILEKTTTKLEESFEMENVENLENAIINIEGYNQTTMNGKYIFTFYNDTINIECVAYIKKGTKIPDNNDGSLNLIPNDCNKYSYKTDFNPLSSNNNTLVLKKVYKFKGSE